jgi:hypothetical protein
MRKLWLPAFVLALIALPAQAAQASDIHPDSRAHLHNMHYAASEQFCVESHDTAKLSNSSARSFLTQTLTGLEDYKTWNGLGGGRIDLRSTLKNCTAYDATTRATIEIEVHYNWDWSSVCGGSWGYYNCVVHDNPVWNADYGHYDSRWAYVYLVYSSGGELSDRGRAFINHEFGHVFGLMDAGDCDPPSIMHSTLVGYGCDNWLNPWPSQADFNSVVAVMNGA